MLDHPLARHQKYAPFACNSPLRLVIEPNPLGRGEFVTERCQCGKVVNVWGVIEEPVRVNDDENP